MVNYWFLSTLRSIITGIPNWLLTLQETYIKVTRLMGYKQNPGLCCVFINSYKPNSGLTVPLRNSVIN